MKSGRLYRKLRRILGRRKESFEDFAITLIQSLGKSLGLPRELIIYPEEGEQSNDESG